MKPPMVHDSTMAASGDLPEPGQLKFSAQAAGTPCSAASTKTPSPGSSAASSSGLSDREESKDEVSILTPPEDTDSEPDLDFEETELEQALISRFLQLALAEDLRKELDVSSSTKALPHGLDAPLRSDFQETDEALRKFIWLNLGFLLTYMRAQSGPQHSTSAIIKDICSILACASVYFRRLSQKQVAPANVNELGSIMTVLIYLAYSHLIDQPIKAQAWHSKLLSKYCDLKTMNAAVMKSFQVLDYNVCVDQKLSLRMCAAIMNAIPEHLRGRSTSKKANQ